MVQRSSLLLGSRIARRMNDSIAADWYDLQASEISLALEHHWSEADGYIVSGLHNARDIRSGLDISTILGVLHSRESPSFQVHEDRVLITVKNLVERFSLIYDINKVKYDTYGRAIGPAIGRYPEDLYDGTGKSRGNPWYLATASIGEYLYILANMYQSQGVIRVTNRSLPFFEQFLGVNDTSVGNIFRDSSIFSKVITACISRGDEFIRRIKYHSAHANLSEQFDANSGMNVGAYDLSWSYASLLSAKRMRARVKGSSFHYYEST